MFFVRLRTFESFWWFSLFLIGVLEYEGMAANNFGIGGERRLQGPELRQALSVFSFARSTVSQMCSSSLEEDQMRIKSPKLLKSLWRYFGLQKSAKLTFPWQGFHDSHSGFLPSKVLPFYLLHLPKGESAWSKSKNTARRAWKQGWGALKNVGMEKGEAVQAWKWKR